MSVVALAVLTGSNLVVEALSHGKSAVSGERATTVHLLRILLFLVVLNGVVAAPSALLIARRRFGIAAAAAAASNVPLVVFLLFRPNPSIEQVAWAIVVGFGLQAVWQLVASVRSGGLGFSFFPTRVSRVAHLALPVSLTLGAATISGLIDVAFSGLAGAGGPAALDKAFRLMLLPYSAVVVAIGVVALPGLVNAADNPDSFERELLHALRLVIAVALPMAVVFAAIPHALVAVAYERGSFGPASTRLTSNALVGMSLVLPALSLSMIGSRAWLSRQRPWPAAALFGAGAVVNGFLDWLLVGPFGLFGICVATAAVHLLAGSILLTAAYRRKAVFVRSLLNLAVKVGVASAAAIGVPAFLAALLDVGNVQTVGVVVIASPLLFGALARALQVREIGEIVLAFRGVRP
jgi:peptidoglycan biosynthesis protein MviN/MurJ (putative lipid II flippase)